MQRQIISTVALFAPILVACSSSPDNSSKSTNLGGDGGAESGAGGVANVGGASIGTSTTTNGGRASGGASHTTPASTGGAALGGASGSFGSSGGSIARAGGNSAGNAPGGAPTMGVGGVAGNSAAGNFGSGNASGDMTNGGSNGGSNGSAGNIAGIAGHLGIAGQLGLAGNKGIAGNGGNAGNAGTANNVAGAANGSVTAECFLARLGKVNVVVLKDAAPSGADVEGRMWVGGNAKFSDYAVNVRSLSSDTCSDHGLVVGGNLSGSVSVGIGATVYGGTSTANVSRNGNCSIYHLAPLEFLDLDKQLKDYSAALAAIAPNGSVDSSGGTVTMKGISSTLNVFSLTIDQLSAGQLKVNVPLNSTVLVNVNEPSMSWPGIGFTMPDGGTTCRGGTSQFCTRILYNFSQATTLSLSGIGVQGSILAPYAALSGSGGNVDGQVFVASLTGSIEYHPYMFQGCLLP